jgi:hypothetical protein
MTFAYVITGCEPCQEQLLASREHMMMRDGIARSTSTGISCDEMDVVSIVESDRGMEALESDQEEWVKSLHEHPRDGIYDKSEEDEEV